jgi:ABC-2 type transport system ATP-binding protein
VNGTAAPASRVSRTAGRTGAGPLVEARDVSQRFGDLVAVDHVDLVVWPGEIVGLLGANGAGKTTLIRMLLGLLRASEGSISLFGEPPSRATRALLGYVPQGLGLWDDLTVTENLAFAAGAFGSRPPAVLDPDLEAARDALVRELPLGLRRRLAFTAALAHGPRLLVLDEPTSGVDPLARARLWDTVHDAAGAGAGALVTTHYMEEASQCDRLIVLADGSIVAAGTVADIVGGRNTLEIECDDWAAAFAALDDAGVPVALAGRRLRLQEADREAATSALAAAGLRAGVRVTAATLEEAFVDIVTGGST